MSSPTIIQVFFVPLSVDIIYYICPCIRSWCKFLLKEIDFGFANFMFIVNLKPRPDPDSIVVSILTS
jgi:hypothetical protein